MKYDIIIHFIDKTELALVMDYEKSYEMQANVSNLGRNGVWEILDDNQIYHPSHNINKIEVIKNKK